MSTDSTPSLKRSASEAEQEAPSPLAPPALRLSEHYQEDGADMELRSTDGVRFLVVKARFIANSTTLATMLTAIFKPRSKYLPILELDETSAVLHSVLRYFDQGPLDPWPLSSFDVDLPCFEALHKYQIWRGIESAAAAYTSKLQQQGLDAAFETSFHALIFANHFRLGPLAQIATNSLLISSAVLSDPLASKTGPLGKLSLEEWIESAECGDLADEDDLSEIAACLVRRHTTTERLRIVSLNKALDKVAGHKHNGALFTAPSTVARKMLALGTRGTADSLALENTRLFTDLECRDCQLIIADSWQCLIREHRALETSIRPAWEKNNMTSPVDVSPSDAPRKGISLSLDLLPVILSHLTNHVHLASCTLVCTSWKSPAQAALYGRVGFDYDYEIVAFTETLERCPHLRHLVRSVDVNVDDLNQDPAAVGIDNDRLVPLLRRTPSLRRLGIGNLVSLEDSAIQGALRSLLNLQHLYLSTGNTNGPDTYYGRIFLDFLSNWSSFSSLALSGSWFWPHTWMPSSPSTTHFTSLDLFAVVFTDEELEWLLSGSEDCLRVFRYVELQSPLGFFNPDRRHWQPTITASRLSAAIIKAGRRLVDLDLGVEVMTPESVATIVASTAQLRKLGIPLTSLGHTTLQYAPSSLRTLQLYQLRASEIVNEASSRGSVAVLRACEIGGVRLVVLKTIYAARLYVGMGEEVLGIGLERGFQMEQEHRFD